MVCTAAKHMHACALLELQHDTCSSNFPTCKLFVILLLLVDVHILNNFQYARSMMQLIASCIFLSVSCHILQSVPRVLASDICLA